jgi:hypothetical protein
MTVARVKLIKGLEALANTPTEQTSDDKEEMFFNAMKEVLSQDARLNLPATLKAMRSKAGPDTYYESVAFIFRYMETSTGILNRNETYALLVKLLKAYVNYIRSAMRVSVTIRTFFSLLSCFDSAVEQSYPGYREYGFLRGIVAPRTSVLEGLTDAHLSVPADVADVAGYIFDPGGC